MWSKGAVCEIRARMTCIGQKSPTILSERVHMLCTRQPVQRNFPVRSKSYSAAYSHIPPLSPPSSYFTLLRLRSTLPIIPIPNRASTPANPSKSNGALSPVVGLSTGAGCGTTGTASSLWVRLDPPGFGVSGTGVDLSDLSL